MNLFEKSWFQNLLLLSLSTAFIVPANSVKAAKVYWSPKINGLEIDRCIHSYKYPDGCSEAATGHAADRFCQYKGYSHATSWEWVDEHTDYQRSVYKLLEEGNSWHFRVQQGSYIFTGILCDG